MKTMALPTPTSQPPLTNPSTSLAEICVKVVEYAEKHSWKQLLDPEKCYAEISKSVKIPPSNQEKDLSRQPTSPTTIIITAPPKKKSTDMVVKRRVYDVLHVLENTGVAKRKSYERTAGYSWLGLKSLASGLSEWKGISRQGGIKYEKALKHTKVPILSTITHMFLRVCYNKPGKTLTLKSAASEIYEELLDRIKREHSKKVPTQKGVERRLYDVVSVLSSVGIVVRSRKAIFIPKQILCKETCTKYAHQAMQHAKKNPQMEVDTHWVQVNLWLLKSRPLKHLEARNHPKRLVPHASVRIRLQEARKRLRKVVNRKQNTLYFCHLPKSKVRR